MARFLVIADTVVKTAAGVARKGDTVQLGDADAAALVALRVVQPAPSGEPARDTANSESAVETTPAPKRGKRTKGD